MLFADAVPLASLIPCQQLQIHNLLVSYSPFSLIFLEKNIFLFDFVFCIKFLATFPSQKENGVGPSDIKLGIDVRESPCVKIQSA